MSLSNKTLKMLWGRAAGRCSHPDCRLDVFFDESEADTPTLVGENCHVISEKDGGPRSDPSVPSDQIDSYSNLILMCRNHHKVIDDTENGEREYSIERLRQIKRDHETWVRDQLGMDPDKQRDEEYYVQIVDGWESKCHIDHWLAWSSSILSHGQPAMQKDVSADLEDARRWIMNRVWPQRYPTLERAFENFRLVLEDFHNTFLSETEVLGERLITVRFYQIREWNEERYQSLLRQYEYHVGMVSDLMLELTRAANLICDEVRLNLMPWYRRDEGRLMVQSGPTLDLSFTEWVAQYRPEETLAGRPYGGLEAFRNDRSTRDGVHFGSGSVPQESGD